MNGVQLRVTEFTTNLNNRFVQTEKDEKLRSFCITVLLLTSYHVLETSESQIIYTHIGIFTHKVLN